MYLLGNFDRSRSGWNFTDPCVVSLVFCALTIGARAACAQALGIAPPGKLSQRVVVDEVDSTVYAQLDRVEALLADSQWDEAVETYRRLVQEHGDQLVRRPAGDGFVRHVPLRQYVDWQLSQLAAEHQPALVAYRRRADAPVRPRLEQARRARDVVLLRWIVESSLLSSYGDDALVALGDLALEAGRHAEARRCYERLHPALRWWPEDGGPPQPLGWVLRDVDWATEGQQIVDRVLSHPFRGDGVAMADADWPVTDVLARLILVSILERDFGRARTELEFLRRLEPGAEGILGGQRVVWVDHLTDLAAHESARVEERRGVTSSALGSWWTVAHDPRRTGLAPAWSDPVAWREDPWQLVWSTQLTAARELATGDTLRQEPTTDDSLTIDHRGLTSVDFPTERIRAFPEVRAAERYTYLLPTHPVVAEGTVYAATGHSIRAYDLRTGQPVAGSGAEGEIFPAAGFELPGGDTPPRGRIGVPRHTLTVTDQLLVARLGSAITTQRALGRTHEGTSYLICLERKTQRLATDVLLPPSPKYAFDGSPVTDGRYLYAALRLSGVTPQAHVICYDLQTGLPRWQRLVAAAPSVGQGSVMEVTHNLLTLDQATGVIYFGTGLGAIAALDAHDGRIRWVTTYPRTGVELANQHQPAWHVQRDLTTCLLHRRLLMVAPPDAQQLYCLDAATGQKIWETQFADGTNDMVQLVGILEDRLIAAGRRLWWIDVNTGQLADDVAVNPYPHSWRDGLAGCGRGVIVGAQVYWPVRGDDDLIMVFDGVSGKPWRTAISLSRLGIGPGNLVAAGDRLLVATPEALHALAPGRSVAPRISHGNFNGRE